MSGAASPVVGMNADCVANVHPASLVGRAPSQLTPEEKVYLITRNLQEVLGADKLLEIVRQRDLKIYWGTATTGAPHIAYFVPMSKIADFLRAGCEVTILFADLHAFLDNMKSSWELLKFRTLYYEAIIKNMLSSIDVPLEKLKFVRGTTFQLSQEYTLDVYRMSSVVTSQLAKKAGADVVKQVSSPLLSGLLYPCLQALDEHYLGVDAQFGGLDQRKIFTFAERYMPRLNYKKAIHLMNPMVPGLTGSKMSSSEKSSKIDILDAPESIAEKIGGAYCNPGEVEGNGVLAFVKMVLFPLAHSSFLVERLDKYGGNVVYNSYAELEAAYVSKELFPQDLKNAVISHINKLLSPIRQVFQSAEMKQLIASAYPKEDEFKQSESKRTYEEEEEEEDGDDNNDEEKEQKPNSAAVPAPATAPSAKKGAVGATVAKKAPKDFPEDPSALDLRVCKVLSAAAHEKSEHLLVCQVDLGEGKPRQVVAGLAKYVSAQELTGRLAVVFANTKATNFKGVRSEAMLVAANLDEKVELLTVPAECKVGEAITFAGFAPLDPMPVHDPDKKYFARLSDHLLTDEQGHAVFKKFGKSAPFATQHGAVKAPLCNARIK